jgi:hypothetical protein
MFLTPLVEILAPLLFSKRQDLQLESTPTGDALHLEEQI